MSDMEFKPVNFIGKDIEPVIGNLILGPGVGQYKKVLIKLESNAGDKILLTEDQLDAIYHWSKNNFEEP